MIAGIVHRVALACVLTIACAREDSRTPTSVTPPPRADPIATPTEGTPPSSEPTQTTAVAEAPPATPPSTAIVTAVVTVIEVDAQAGPLDQQLVAIAARGKKEARPVTVELWAGWCPPCKKLDRLLGQGAVAEALGGSILVRVDVDMFDEELNQMGFTAPQIPSMYRIDGRGRPRGKPLQGGDWSKRSEAEIAAALRTFLAG